MTAAELIRSSLRLIQELAPGQTQHADDDNDALFVLNSMLDGWSIDRLNIYHIKRSDHTLVANQSSYTIGTGGNFNVARPVRIDNAGIILDDGSEKPLSILDPDEYAMVWQKTFATPIPWGLYCDYQHPLASLFLVPVASVAYGLALYSWQVLSSIASVATTISFPPGYADAIRYNLAVRLAPEWGRVLRPDVKDLAVETRAKIQMLNAPAPIMRVDPAYALGGDRRRGFDLRNPYGR